MSEGSRLLTTFITPFGRFCFNRLPYGISIGTEQFQKVMTDLLGDIDKVEVQIDDVLVHGRDQVQHDDRLHQVLNMLAESKIILNKVKCEFSVNKVKVLGHIVSSEVMSADPEKIQAIRNLATPRNVAEVFGFGNGQPYVKISKTKTRPLRGAFEKENPWIWVNHRTKDSQKSKKC